MDRLEQIAMALHDGWWDHRLSTGWKLGPRSGIRKTHPHLVPWSLLEDSAKNQDRFIAAVLLYRWSQHGRQANPKLIHELWRRWEKAHGRKYHPHDVPYAHVHSSDPGEHRQQAGRVNAVLKGFGK